MGVEDFGFSRDSLLSGLSTRRSTALLFAIESRTARLMQQDRPIVATYVSQEAIQSQEAAFYEALAGGRDLPIQPSIQDIEYFAPVWASLVPEDDNTRAGVAHLLAEKYILPRTHLPQLRQALGLDTPDVGEAYRRIYDQPLDSIYAPTLPLRERLRWLSARGAHLLAALPPFWFAFLLTLPVGAGLLALPISLARIGTLTSILLLAVFGLINMVTVAALAEAVARNGVMRYGLGFLGQIVSDYLGSFASLVLTVILLLNNFLVLIVFYLGIGGTLESTLNIPASVWFVVICGVGLYFVSRRSLNTTVTFTLVISVCFVAAIAVMLVSVLPYVRLENITAARGQSGFDPSLLELVFGALVTVYFSHMLVATYGRVVLRRDPGARHWIRGSAAAIFAMILISSIWLIIINGAFSPDTLAAQTGTIIEPMAQLVGPLVSVVGSLFVIISVGISTIHVSLGLFFLVQERLAGLEARLPILRVPRWTFALSAAPIVLVLIVTEWLSATGSGSFSALLSFLGVIALPLLSGIFPILLLIASRHKADYVPAWVSRLIGNPILLSLIYMFYLALIFVYAFVIWQTTVERVATLIAGLAVIAVTAAALRGTALRPRLVVEVKLDDGQPGASTINVVENGVVRPTTLVVRRNSGENQSDAPLTADLRDLRGVQIQLTLATAREVKVWVHRLTAEGASEGRRFVLDIGAQHWDALTGSILMPCEPGQALDIRITMASD